MKDGKKRIILPLLRPSEMPDIPATVLDIPPEKDTFVISGERISREERESMARAVEMPPLLPAELPDSLIRAVDAQPDPRLDEPEWGAARRAPEIVIGNGKLLRPWDD